MGCIWRTLGSYIFWTHDRGSLHYDVMVTCILLFVFLAPRWIDFNDKPTQRIPHQTEVIVTPDGKSGFIYQVDARALRGAAPEQVTQSLRGIIEPIAGEVEIVKQEPVVDNKGKVRSYKVWVQRL